MAAMGANMMLHNMLKEIPDAARVDEFAKLKHEMRQNPVECDEVAGGGAIGKYHDPTVLGMKKVLGGLVQYDCAGANMQPAFVVAHVVNDKSVEADWQDCSKESEKLREKKWQ